MVRARTIELYTLFYKLNMIYHYLPTYHLALHVPRPLLSTPNLYLDITVYYLTVKEALQ